MTTADLQFLRDGAVHVNHRGDRFCLDRLIDSIEARPREVESLCLDGWFTERSKPSGGVWTESILVSPDFTEHVFHPSRLINTQVFPVLVYKRGRRLIVVDGIHRLVKAVRSKRSTYQCIYVSAAELKQAKV